MGRSLTIFALCWALLGAVSSQDFTTEPAVESEESGFDFDLNGIIDGIFGLAKEQILLQNLDELPIPDIKETFDKKVGFFRLKGSFNATEGFVNSLSSIKRTGDVLFDIDGNAMTLTSHLGFGVLRVRYDKYRVEIFGTGPQGKISASVDSNSIRLRFRLEVRNDGCGITLGEVSVVDLGRFEVKISGLGSLDWLASRIATAVTEKRRGDIMERIEKTLTKTLTDALGRFRCDDYFKEIKEQLGKLGLS